MTCNCFYKIFPRWFHLLQVFHCLPIAGHLALLEWSYPQLSHPCVFILWGCFGLACRGLLCSVSLAAYWGGLLRPAFLMLWLCKWLTACSSLPDMVFNCFWEYSCDRAICIIFYVSFSPSAISFSLTCDDVPNRSLSESSCPYCFLTCTSLQVPVGE